MNRTTTTVAATLSTNFTEGTAATTETAGTRTCRRHATQARRARRVWVLWDAGEFVSTHPTRADAATARADLLADRLADFPHDRTDLEESLMIEPTTASAAAEEDLNAGSGDWYLVWALRDATDLVSLHATEAGAHAARSALLHQETARPATAAGTAAGIPSDPPADNDFDEDADEDEGEDARHLARAEQQIHVAPIRVYR